MNLKQPKTILYCPLNWGLGHASRGVFLIRKFLDRGFEVILAADGEPLALLQNEFPQLGWIQFTSFRIRYTKRIPLLVKLLFYLPVMLIGIAKEHRELKRILMEYAIDIVISDNRYGLWNRHVLTIFITHQVSIRLPAWLSWFQYPLYRLSCNQIRKFNYAWIPDIPGEKSLTSELSQKYPLPENARFTGIFSRFMYDDPGSLDHLVANYDLLVILSGPEPQRTILEEKICNQLKMSRLKTLIVRGLPSHTDEFSPSDNLTLVPHLPSNKLRVLIKASKMVITRSGYSTIMDLIALRKTALLIPTPGQTEQQYLGKRMEQKKYFHCLDQRDFDLSKVIAYGYDYTIQFSVNHHLIDRAINDLMRCLSLSEEKVLNS